MSNLQVYKNYTYIKREWQESVDIKYCGLLGKGLMN